MSTHTYQQFIFERYEFDTSDKTIRFHYSLDGIIEFCETYTFNFEFAPYDPNVLDKAVQTLFFMAGVSYYKTYIPSEIVVKQGSLDAEEADFYSKVYQRGLGEFWYVNGLDPGTPVDFPTTSSAPPRVDTDSLNSTGLLIGLGGGKDSLVTIELLRQSGQQISTWALGHHKQLQPLVKQTGLPHFAVDRQWDRKLLEINESGGLNGHVPISAIMAATGIVTSILSGRRDVVVSNEYAANEATLVYRGVLISHQYSKSQEFERDFQAHLARIYGDKLRYYSFLRPLSELRIAELFAKTCFDTYKGVFSSCNHAYTHYSPGLYWCGTCPKCAFVFLIFTPFIDRSELESLWGDKNLLLDPTLRPTYRQLLGIEGNKPLECVGEIRESRTAMRLAESIYPELTEHYDFTIPADYNYKELQASEMPAEIQEIFIQSVQKY